MAQGNGADKFDLASIGMTKADEGSTMVIAHPVTRQPIMMANGQPMSITLTGRFSETNRRTLRRIQVERVELLADRQTVTEEHITKENIEQLCACTMGWNIDELDGAPFPCSPANIRKLWTDKRFLWLHERALAFIGEDRNFLSVSSALSSDMPATFSASPNPSPTTGEPSPTN